MRFILLYIRSRYLLMDYARCKLERLCIYLCKKSTVNKDLGLMFIKFKQKQKYACLLLVCEQLKRI